MSKMAGKTCIDIIYSALVCMSVLSWTNVQAAKMQFDLEIYLENSDIEALMPRSNANGSTSVLLKVGQYVEIPFCLPVEASVSIEELIYSNDGDSDTVPIFIDGQIVGSFQSRNHTDWGHKWNEFVSSGPVGDSKKFPPGFHKIQISVNETDENGVELDIIQLDVDIPDFEDEEYLRCGKCQEQVIGPEVEDKANNPADESTGAVLLLQNQGLVTGKDGTSSIVVDMIPRPMVPCRVLAVSPWYAGGVNTTQGPDATEGPEATKPRTDAAKSTQEFVIEARSDSPSSDKSTMTVIGIQNEPVEGAEVVQISVRANEGQDLVPVFQLQQDGGITITSPLLGEFPPADQRSLFKLAPYLSGIKSVNVDPTDLTLNVTFEDDSVVRLRIDATSETAEFTVLGADLNTDLGDNPFVSFATPWMSDADNGADTIVTNGRTVNQLLTGWDSLEASTVDFVNRCGSNDRVTGPDWKIELLA